MRYEDASSTFQASGPIANDDSDTLTAGSRGPATGNLLTGEGTQYGSAGADSAAGAQVTAIAGKGGEDSSFAGGKLSVSGEFGQLSVDADGNYSYLANTGAPENVRDRFVYTLADTQGNSDTAALIVEIGKTPVVIKADAQQVVPGPDGVVTLPPGVELSDIMVVGRNLVVNMPDGTQLVIVDGAVFVPQLVLGGVEVPATNVAALLIGQEVQPAAGETPPSSGGNFALPPPPLDPGIPLGDLLPPTELDYNPPEPQDVFPVPDDEEPEITIQPDGQPASVNAVDEVDEAGLPGRDGNLPDEPEGSGEEAAAGDNGDPSEATGGTIIIDSPDGVDSVTIAGADGIPHEIVVGLIVEGEFGTLTITDQVGDNYVYSYVLNDNTPGDDTQDDFEVVLTDGDGDTATATLTIDIIDDVPTARPDTDVIAAGEFGPVTGNVITDADGGDEGDDDDGRDTVGADDADLTDVTGFGDTEAVEGGWVVQGQYGVLTISSDGSYSYTRNEGTPGGVTDVFNYDLTDGDGDVSSTTLTITIEDTPIEIGENPIVRTDDDAVAGADGNAGTPEIGDDVDSENLTGTLSGSGGDGPLTFDLLTTGAPDGFTYVDGPDGSVLVQQVQNGSTVTVLTITINASTGAYEVTQDAPILHPEGGDIENNLDFTINYTVSDQDDDVENGTLTINVDDDSPSIEAGEVEPELLVDESELTVNETQNFGDVFTTLFGADGGDADSTEYLLDINAGATGLTDTATGEDVVLVMNDGVVEGRTATTNELVFTVTVNDDGDVTVDQLRAVVHPDDSDPDDPIGLANDDLITLTATVTDNDGDTASETIGIGNNIVLEDDGPTANDDVGNQAGEDQPITVDVLANDEAGADGVDDADVSYVDGTLTGSGELVYNGDGTFTYTPAPGETGDIFFDYQILDGDNDPSVATVTIHLGDDSTPQVGTPENLEVDEDGFAFANDDEGQVNPTETDHGENLTDSGNVVVDFGNDVPGDLDASIVLLDNGALDGQLVDLDGNPVTFTLNGSGQLVGSTANGTVMIISIT
ncbi:MAG TPA: DUF5801 repeats-in-toxin domain-containing protein, partial [Sphingomicrobium sp.]|nr:DUF5801 repeats-in-toxin domain-containing protein [Sphingomicrobium sp.]